MVSVTLSVTEELRRRMKQFDEINWSAIIRKTIEKKIQELSWREEILKRLKKEEGFTSWTIDMGRKIKSERLKELKKRGII